jgi:EAL domain-containing protein (putative c-di-GMP-specific phosphodiesterase class I)/GGDEF domain-containing protein
MSSGSLLDSLPDLVVLARRDGVVLYCGGGRGTERLLPANAAGKRFAALWPRHVAEVLRQLVRKSIALRATAEARFRDDVQEYEARAFAQGPDRAICIIRALAAPRDESLDATDSHPRPQLDRRRFQRRFRESVSFAALREKSLAVAVIHLDGVADIAQIIDGRLSEQIMSTAILRLPEASSDGPGGQPSWYLGQLSESLLALVIGTSDRDAIEACVARVCASLREPVSTGAAEFHLTPYAGVALLEQDATSPRALLEHARAAASEARRMGTERVCFFTDTPRLESLARADIARELSDAIANRDIRLRYVGRHDLATGRLVTWVGYLCWDHPLRGEVRPAEFLRAAETTGLATALSRAVLSCLRDDFIALAAASDPDVRISFGALRHHLLHENFVGDIARFLEEGAVPAERLELRIAEKTLIAREPAHIGSLTRLGVRLVVDEVGRGIGSLDWLARAPIWGLQLDRAWVTALRRDEVALRVCRAGIGVAAALGLTPIATGVDDQAQRDALLALGCSLGSGDLYPSAKPDVTGLPAVAN